MKSSVLIDKHHRDWCKWLTSGEGGSMTITFEINMASLVWVVMFVVDNVLSKLKGYLFNKGKVIEVMVRIGSSLHFHRERFVPFLK